MLGLMGMFFLLQLIGLIRHDADHEHDVDHDHDVDHEHDVDGDGDADGDHDGEHAGGGGVLAFFGIGRVPFMVVWVTLFLFMGFSGLFASRVAYANLGDFGVLVFLLILAGAFLVGLLGVRLFSRLAARLVDTGGKGATAKHELSGKQGVVASARLDHSFGEVRVQDSAGSEMIVHARLDKDEAELARGAKVVLIDYDAQKGLFWVTAVPEVGIGGADDSPRT